jgi:hypothetical protein
VVTWGTFPGVRKNRARGRSKSHDLKPYLFVTGRIGTTAMSQEGETNGFSLFEQGHYSVGSISSRKRIKWKNTENQTNGMVVG